MRTPHRPHLSLTKRLKPPLYCLRIAPSHDPDGVPGWRSLVVGLLTEPQSGGVSTVGYGKSSRSGDDPWGLVPDEADTARALLDSSGRITHWNDGARRLLGHTAARMLGRSAAELLADPVVVTAPSRHERPLPWRGTVELRHRDGRRLTVRLLAHRLRQQEGGFEGWLLVSPLVGTERTEEDNRLPRPAFRYAPNALALYDTEIRLRRANQAMEEVIGLTEGEARGLRLSEIGGKPQSIELEEQLRQVLESGRPRDVRTRLRTGGEPREHAWLGRIAPMWDARGELVGVALSAVDITGEDRAQALLQLVNDASWRIGTTLEIGRTALELVRSRALAAGSTAGTSSPAQSEPGSAGLSAALFSDLSRMAEGPVPCAHEGARRARARVGLPVKLCFSPAPGLSRFPRARPPSGSVRIAGRR